LGLGIYALLNFALFAVATKGGNPAMAIGRPVLKNQVPPVRQGHLANESPWRQLHAM
jgi:hypothetical protein